MALLANDIYIGSVSDPLYHYTNDKLEAESAKGLFSVDVIGNELPIDQFSFVVRYDPYGSDALVYAVINEDDNTVWDAYLTAERTTPPKESASLYLIAQPTPQNYLSDVPYGTPVYWYIANAFFAKGYLKSVERVGAYAFKLTCISGVGLLDTKMHTGGLYSGTTVNTLLANIIGDSFSYTVADDVKNIAVYGHLPYDTARNNLHRLLFAVGAVMRKNTAASDYQFVFLGNTITDIPASRVSINGSVSTQLPANKVEITEHGFYSLNTDETVVLFDNTGAGAVSADHQLVVFDNAPVHNLSVTGSLTIDSSGVNHAVVTGTGVLSGKLYTHTTQIVVMEDNPDNAPERVMRVTENELVSAVNSRNVARRVLSFYKSAKTVKGKIMLTTEKSGDYVQVTDAFGDLTQGYLHKTEITPTTVKGANVEIIDGYISDANGNNYQNMVVLTAGNSWIAPAGTNDMRMVLVGAGSGAQGGYDGAAGLGGSPPMVNDYFYIDPQFMPHSWQLHYVDTQPPSSGGAAGAGGAQGKILVVDRDVSPGDVVSYSIGKGGAGGAKNGGAGSAGTPTTAALNGESFSSANGSDYGYYDPIGKKTYGLPGKKGYKGGIGGTSGSNASDGNTLNGCGGGNGVNGGSVAGFVGGVGGTGTGTSGLNYPTEEWLKAYKFTANGSGGGGAAYGNAGNPGGTWSAEEVWNGSVLTGVKITGAKGGDGADALPPQKASYGNGGNGGNGGGAGGNASGVRCYHPYVDDEEHYQLGGIVGDAPSASNGGSGSVGGDGGDGCVIIYY